jgi:hypothetical protein
LQIAFHNLEPSEELAAIIRTNAAKLDEFHSHILTCRVVVDVPHQHHGDGNLFRIRIDLTVPGGEIVVNREPSLHAVNTNFIEAVRDAFDAARRQLEDFARQQRSAVKHREPAPHAKVARLFPKEGYGFIETPDGWEIYFHKDSVLHGPRRFARIARRVSRRKPIVAVKAGRTRAGGRAAGSHTAALAARDVAVDALFRQTGVIRADTLEEMFDLAAALGSQPLPPGRRVAVVTNAGGPAILCADACEAAGLSLPELLEQTRTQLAAFLPTTASLGNPVDMIASATPADFGRAVRILLPSDEVDALIVICVSTGTCEAGDVTRTIQENVAAVRGGIAAGKPVLICLMPEQTGLSLAGSGSEKIPCYAFPEAAAYTEWRTQPLGRFVDFADLDPPAARALCQQALERRGSGWLSIEETRRVLQAVC